MIDHIISLSQRKLFSFEFCLDPNKVIRTELSLMPEEFENFRVGVDTDVTFCLKELRVCPYQ